MTKKKIFYNLVPILFAATIDQVSKQFFITYLEYKPPLNILPILDFVYAWNYGISFGLFSKYYEYSNIIFLSLNSLIVVYLYSLMLNTKSNLSYAGFILVISGALGNIIDRVLYGAVFDFIYFHYHNLSFPAFNVADSFITIGACFLIYDYMFCRSEKK